MCRQKIKNLSPTETLVIWVILAVILLFEASAILKVIDDRQNRAILKASVAPAPFAERVREPQYNTQQRALGAATAGKLTQYSVQGQVVQIRRKDGKIRRVVVR